MPDHTRIHWADIATAARKTSEDLAGKDWVQAGIKARVLLADLADEVDRLKAENRQLRHANANLGLTLARTASYGRGVVSGPECTCHVRGPGAVCPAHGDGAAIARGTGENRDAL